MLTGKELKKSGVSELCAGRVSKEGDSSVTLITPRGDLFPLKIESEKLGIKIMWGKAICRRNPLVMRGHVHDPAAVSAEENNQRSKITEGMVLAEVDEIDISGLSYGDIMVRLQQKQRPLQLAFMKCNSRTLHPPGHVPPAETKESNGETKGTGIDGMIDQSRDLNRYQGTHGEWHSVTINDAQLGMEVQWNPKHCPANPLMLKAHVHDSKTSEEEEAQRTHIITGMVLAAGMKG